MTKRYWFWLVNLHQRLLERIRFAIFYKLSESSGWNNASKDVAELSKYYGSELWKLDFAADEAGNLPPDLKRGVLSEDGIWNLLSDYRNIQKKKQ